MPNTEEILKLEGKVDTLTSAIINQGIRWEVQLKEMKSDFEEFESRLDSHSDQINSLIIWRDSNGSPGAEDRLRHVEQCAINIDKENLPDRVCHNEADIRVLQGIADSAIMKGVQGAVNDTLDKRARTAVEILKAWGPIVAAALAATVVVLAAVL